MNPTKSTNVHRTSSFWKKFSFKGKTICLLCEALNLTFAIFLFCIRLLGELVELSKNQSSTVCVSYSQLALRCNGYDGWLIISRLGVQASQNSFYRPQRSCGQGYVFTRVCDSVHRGVSGEPPPGPRRTPPDQSDPPGMENPPGARQTPPVPRRTPPTRQTPPPPWDQADPPRTRQIPPGEDCSIRSMSGRYASYWNAFLFILTFCHLISWIRWIF